MVLSDGAVQVRDYESSNQYSASSRADSMCFLGFDSGAWLGRPLVLSNPNGTVSK
jgi:hypothetical protein